MARQDFINAEELVQRLNAAFETHKKVVAESAAEFKKYQGEFNKLPSGYIKAQKDLLDIQIKQSRSEQQLIRAMQQKEKLSQDQIRTSKIQLQLDQQKEKISVNAEKRSAKEAADLTRAQSLYTKIQSKVNSLTATYNNLAARKEIGLKLNTKEEAQLLSLESRLTKYQGVLKKVDAGIGKYTRNVGNYASGFNPLNNAVGQFARELPNAGISFQVFAMSLSNQFGQLQDAIASTVAQNKELIAQGQPIKSVGSQILSSLFSLSTAMYLGIALFTAYNQEISDFVTNLFKGSKAIDVIKESTEALNTIRLESAKSITQERIELQNNLKVAQDTTLSLIDREIAAEKVLSQYPYWFENLGKEAIMNGNVEKAVKGVNDALLARSKATAAVDKITENQSKIIDLEEERFELLKEIEKQEKFNEKAQNRAVESMRTTSEGAYNTAEASTRKLLASRNKLADINKDINSLEEINNRLISYSLTEREKSIGLDYQTADATKNKTEALKDYIANEYELIRTRLENEASINQRVFEDETVNYERRVQAAARYNELQRSLADARLKETLRLLENETAAEITEIKKRIKEKEITEKNGNAVIFTLQKQAQFDWLKAYEDYAEDLRQVDISIEESMKGVWNAINFQKAKNLISERDLEQTKEYASVLENMTQNTDYKKFEEAQKQFAESSREITKANIQAEIDRIEVEMLGLKDSEGNVQKRLELQNQLMEKQREMTNVTKEETEEQLEAWAKLQKATEDYLNGIANSRLSDMGLGSLGKFFDGTFDKLIEGANTVGEKFAVTFNAITEVAQETFNFLNQNSQAYFDAQYARLGREKEVAIKYAGENAAGREEIERQYEEKMREVRIREARQQKEMALFNAAINIAQGITAALAQGPQGIPMSIIIGALGAVQLAMIASRPLPAYAEGTDNHPGGKMIVNDAKGSNYLEMVKEPNKAPYIPLGRNRLLDAPKGTKVFTAEKTMQQLNAMLMDNNIAPVSDVLMRNQLGNVTIEQNGGLTASEMDRVIGKHFKSIQTVNTTWDAGGVKQWVGTQTAKKINLNNRVNFNGIKV